MPDVDRLEVEGGCRSGSQETASSGAVRCQIQSSNRLCGDTHSKADSMTLIPFLASSLT